MDISEEMNNSFNKLGSMLKGLNESEKLISFEIDMNLIKEDLNQPRVDFKSIKQKELNDSVKQRGILQPISIRENIKSKGKYIINAGARRFRAAQEAGFKKIPAIINNDFNYADQIAENMIRDDLSLIEEIKSIAFLLKDYKQSDIVKKYGLPKSRVSKLAKLSKKMGEIEPLIKKGKLTGIRTAYEFISKKDIKPVNLDTDVIMPIDDTTNVVITTDAVINKIILELSTIKNIFPQDFENAKNKLIKFLNEE